MCSIRARILAWAAFALLGCSGEEPAPTSGAAPAELRAAPVAPPAYWVERDDPTLAAEVRAACERALATERPVLLVFSAPWCKDCQLVRRWSTEAPLRDELARWEVVVADVGRMDRHRVFTDAFGVNGIAWWVAMRPTSCEGAPHRWHRLRDGLIEPATGGPALARPEALSQWLAEARDR